MSPWPHVPDAIGTSPKCGVRKAGTDAGPGLGATQGKVGGVNTGALPAALSPLELWLLHKTLSEPQNRLPSARGAQSPAQGEWATSWGGTLEIPELDNMWFESQEAEEEEKEECGLADRDGLSFPWPHIFLHWRFAVRVENVVGGEGSGATGGFRM